MNTRLLTIVFCLLPLTFCLSADWPIWFGSPQRTNVSAETGLPDGFTPGTSKPTIPGATMGTLKWSVKLGNAALASPAVADGRVYIGSANVTGDPRYGGTRDVLQCLDEATGKLLWQLNLPPRGGHDGMGMAAPPTIVGDRAYLFTIGGTFLCLDVNGMTNGNDGPVTDEAKRYGNAQFKLNNTDADIVWEYDIRAQLKASQHDCSYGSPVVENGLVFINTSNGNGGHIQAPDCPSLIALDAKTGTLVAQEAEGVGHNLIHGGWSSPSYAEVDGKGVILFGGGDGFLYAFDANPTPATGGAATKLTCLWKYDANLPLPTGVRDQRREIIATPVANDGLVYVATGQDYTYGAGPAGGVSCVDLKTGKAVWTFTGVKRIDSTPAVADGLFYVGDLAGNVFCLDAKTGKQMWTQKLPSPIIGSLLVADKKLYAITDNGTLCVFSASATKQQLSQSSLGARCEGTPCAANGVLYLPTYTTLYAVTLPTPVATTPPAG